MRALFLSVLMLGACCFLSPPRARAAGFKEEFAAVQAGKNEEEIQKFLERSESGNVENPDYYIVAANYWWSQAQQVSITSKPSTRGGFSVRDQKTGKEVGSIGEMHEETAGGKAITLLDKAAAKFPERADIWMGLAFLQHEMGREEGCAKALDALLDRCAPGAPAPVWKDGGPFPKPMSDFLPESMQLYSNDFFREESKEGDARCQHLCERLIQVFPNHPYAYNNLAALSHAHHDDAAALKYLETARDKAPDDGLVQMNLGEAYLRNGDKQKAAACFQAAAKNADPDLRQQAGKALKGLRAKATKKK